MRDDQFKSVTLIVKHVSLMWFDVKANFCHFHQPFTDIFFSKDTDDDDEDDDDDDKNKKVCQILHILELCFCST